MMSRLNNLLGQKTEKKELIIHNFIVQFSLIKTIVLCALVKRTGYSISFFKNIIELNFEKRCFLHKLKVYEFLSKSSINRNNKAASLFSKPN